MIENKIAIFGGIFLGLGLLLLFALLFWVLKRARLVKEEKEKKVYGGLIRGIIFFLSLIFIFLAGLFFQLRDNLRPFSPWIQSEQVLSSEKIVGEIRTELRNDSILISTFYTRVREGKVYPEEFELSSGNEFKLEAEVLYWDRWVKYFGFADGYKLTQLKVLSPDLPEEKIRTYKLSGGPTDIWKKIYGWRKFLFMVKPKKLESDIFVLDSGATKKVYVKDKKIVVK